MKNGSVWQYPELLAHAVAHELGHIFGLRDHNSAGLMSTNWSRTTFRRMTQEGMRLSSVEIRGLQQSMRERMGR